MCICLYNEIGEKKDIFIYMYYYLTCWGTKNTKNEKKVRENKENNDLKRWKRTGEWMM